MGEAVTPEHEHDTPESWPKNYFNYFTEIEEHFQRTRGTALFLLSPLDWALIEVWKNAGIPLDAVRRGIDEAFEKWKNRRVKNQQINGLAYCTQAVMEQAKILANATPADPVTEDVSAPFSASELEAYLRGNAAAIRQSGRAELADMATTLESLAADALGQLRKLEELEQRLTAMEDKMMAIGRAAQTDEDLFESRRELDSYLKPYRSKMTADQLVMLEKQFLDRRLLEKLKVPRLSLFYLH
ncbi:MAG: hypothetical protein JNK87_12985 [Bryobacterales bacterium]|nr:hypothetical protein [Bryobacterales bacterium]